MLKRIAAAIPDLGLAAAFVLALQGGLDPAMRDHFLRAALLEFPAIHCGGFLMWPWIAGWSGRTKALYVAGLVAAYALVVGVVALVIHAWWPLVIFLGLVANRAAGIALMPNPEGGELDRIAHAWGGTIVLFVVAAIVGGMGGTREAIYAAAAFYFGAIAVSELAGWAWVRRWMGRARRRGPPPGGPAAARIPPRAAR
jgi:hypothetical protein